MRKSVNAVLIVSPIDFLGTQLEEYVAKLSVPVHVVRMGERTGLIRARLRGKGLRTKLFLGRVARVWH